MKKLALPIIICCLVLNVNAQNVGLGTTTPNGSAVLDMTSTTKGVLVPRMTSAQRVTIVSPAKGLLVFDNTTSSFWFHTGTAWTELAVGAGNELWQLQDTIVYTGNNYVGVNADYSLMAPQANLQVNGSILVQGKLVYSNANPTAGQTFTMNNTAGDQLVGPDSLLRVYDPGGTGNYFNNMQGNIRLYSGSNYMGIRISSVATDWGLGTGDTLWVSMTSFPFCRTNYEMRFVNGSASPEDFIIPFVRDGSQVNIIFRSNSDGNNGKGFNFKIVKLYNNEPVKKLNAAGPAFYFNSSDGSIGAGFNNRATRNSTAFGSSTAATGLTSFATGTEAIASGHTSFCAGWESRATGTSAVAAGLRLDATGDASTALGGYTLASGDNATATGENTEARGRGSFSMGYYTLAIGRNSLAAGEESNAAALNSTAIGYHAVAVGEASVAMGYNTVTSGLGSFAIGIGASAIGEGSMALGSHVNTNSRTGSLLIGDRSTTTDMTSGGDNSFKARFEGGYRFYTSAATTSAESCLLSGGSNAWSTASDVRLKENFEAINGEEFLQKISKMPLSSWNYKQQNPTNFRHYGPMAQDFFAAFGKDSYGVIGNDTTINSADFDGVNLIAIQALEKRTQKIQQLEKENSELRIRLEKLEAILLGKKQ
jgi:hypothetical protein